MIKSEGKTLILTTSLLAASFVSYDAGRSSNRYSKSTKPNYHHWTWLDNKPQIVDSPEITVYCNIL